MGIETKMLSQREKRQSWCDGVMGQCGESKGTVQKRKWETMMWYIGL